MSVRFFQYFSTKICQNTILRIPNVGTSTNLRTQKMENKNCFVACNEANPNFCSTNYFATCMQPIKIFSIQLFFQTCDQPKHLLKSWKQKLIVLSFVIFPKGPLSLYGTNRQRKQLSTSENSFIKCIKAKYTYGQSNLWQAQFRNRENITAFKF